MQLYLSKNGVQTGPFSEDQIRSMLAGGVVSPSDYCWHEGLPGWVSVSDVLGPPAPPPAVARPMAARPVLARPAQAVPGAASVAFPAAAQWAAAPAQARAYAGFWLRVVAYIIDAVVMFVAFLPVGFVLAFAMAAAGIEEMALVQLVSFLANTAAWWLYFALMESSAKQATLGKMALGLVVTDLQGQRLSFSRATGRYFGMLVSALALCIGFIMCAFTEKKQCLHDIMAGCLVSRK